MNPKGKVRASSSAVLKRPRVPFRTGLLFGAEGCGADLSIVCPDTREDSCVCLQKARMAQRRAHPRLPHASVCGIPASRRLSVLDRGGLDDCNNHVCRLTKKKAALLPKSRTAK